MDREHLPVRAQMLLFVHGGDGLLILKFAWARGDNGAQTQASGRESHIDIHFSALNVVESPQVCPRGLLPLKTRQVSRSAIMSGKSNAHAETNKLMIESLASRRPFSSSVGQSALTTS